MEKECLHCGKKFITDKRNYGRQKYCSKRCGHEGWRKLNPEKNHEQAIRDRKRRKDDPIRYQEWKDRAKIKNKTPRGKFTHYKKGATSRGYLFSLTFDEFMTFWQKPCHYCGDNIETVGIDRVDNSHGYTLKNSVPCCKTCNDMKKTLDVNFFIKKCKQIVNKLGTVG